MSVKITVIFLCAAVGTFTGYMIMRSYKLKREYLREFGIIVSEIKTNISYRRDGIVNILRSLTVNNSLLSKNISGYISYAVGETDKPILDKGYLSDEAHKLTSDFFSVVGRSDGKSQINELDMYAKKLSELFADADDKCKKHGVAAVKLGFLIGLGIGILVL